MLHYMYHEVSNSEATVGDSYIHLHFRRHFGNAHLDFRRQLCTLSTSNWTRQFRQQWHSLADFLEDAYTLWQLDARDLRKGFAAAKQRSHFTSR